MAKAVLRAFAVTEHDEGSGAIIFAKHAIVARRTGANEHGNGELSYVSCRRAPWADRYAEVGDVPAAVMVAHGWHFECAGCGRRIDDDLPHAWENEVGRDEPLRGKHLLYARWRPEHVIGSQRSAVFCRKSCEAWHRAYVKERDRRERKVIARFKDIVMRRFPDADIVDNDERYLRPHCYVTRDNERWQVSQVIVSFRFPGAKHGPASLRWDRPHRGRPEKPHYTCASGDRDVFEAWALEQKSRIAA